jgi:hypothetical protein
MAFFELVIQELYGYHQVKFLTAFEKADVSNSGLLLSETDDFSARYHKARLPKYTV